MADFKVSLFTRIYSVPSVRAALGRRTALQRGIVYFEELVLVIPVPSDALQDRADVPIDCRNIPKRNLLARVHEFPIKMLEQELSDLVERWQRLPTECAQSDG